MSHLGLDRNNQGIQRNTTREVKKSGSNTESSQIEREKITDLTQIQKNTINNAFTNFASTDLGTITGTASVAQESLIGTLATETAEKANEFINATIDYLFSGSAMNDAGIALSGSIDYITSDQLGKDIQSVTDYVVSGDLLNDLDSGIDDIVNYFSSGQITSDAVKSIGGSLMTVNTFGNGSFAKIMAQGLGMDPTEGSAGKVFCDTFCENLATKNGIDMMTKAASIVTDIKLTTKSTTDLFNSVNDVFNNFDNPIIKAATHPDTVNHLAKTVLGNAKSAQTQTSGQQLMRKAALKLGKSIVALAHQYAGATLKSKANDKAKFVFKRMAIKQKLNQPNNLMNLEKKLIENPSKGSSNILAAIELKRETENGSEEEKLTADNNLSTLILQSYESQKSTEPNIVIKNLINNDFKDPPK